MTPTPTNTTSAAKVQTKERYKTMVMVPWQSIEKDEFINLTSTKRGFWTVHHSVTTYEQTKKGLS